MADTIAEAVTEAVENITENANVNVKVPASFEGMCVAYGSLVFMALLPIYFGAKRSVGHQKDQMVSVVFCMKREWSSVTIRMLPYCTWLYFNLTKLSLCRNLMRNQIS